MTAGAETTGVGPGRPRLEQRRRQGRTARAEILDAAAELFTANGYGNTSTRAVADAVGIRQASLYHHFAAKEDILDALLAETVAVPAPLAERLRTEAVPAVVRLYALAWYDVWQLCAARWNTAALYAIPELRTERFRRFRLRRDELRRQYETLAAATVDRSGATGVSAAIVLPFRLVETVVDIRSDEGDAPEWAVRAIPDAIIRMLGRPGELAEVRAQARAFLSACGIEFSDGA
ncbi:helix-turn-helix domain-containing protein [Nocardia stercoris]|uniref:TetR/AcrR family transcriptional regulator n=1 Tax=Nocardia stercoris TaxID=2483361 RepID=A0A3M2KT06_9NOCA|nr:TetR/AcrR family transcriptional regulator [Nocardia stercoris]RMI28064.1 TetR/AcrR family transcriptional regulator [Nocardia stercoris]